MAKTQKTGKEPPQGEKLPAPGANPERGKALANIVVSGSFNAAAVVQPFQRNLIGEEVTAEALIAELRDRLATMQAGDMTHVESMLLSQATALQTIFASLARRTAGQEYLKNYQTFLTLALKAQAQSRATLEALIELKLPRHPPTFVKQANIAHGPQQVNNGGAPATPPARPEQAQDAPNKLLEANHGPMDTGVQAAAGRGNPKMEAMGAVNRSEDRRGQGARVAQCVEGRAPAENARAGADGQRTNR